MTEKFIPTLPGFEQTAAVVRVVRVQESPAPLHDAEVFLHHHHHQDGLITMDGVETSNNAFEVDIDTDPMTACTIDSSDTISIASSVFDFRYANGRRYHSDRFDSQYFLPNDEAEQDRLDLYHHMFLLLLGGKLYSAPLENPRRVLDVGTGTGIWALDFAEEFPQAEVIGPDISPIQPRWVPPNCTFEVDDLEGTWSYPDNYFDYVHIRSMGGTFKDWDKVFSEVYSKTAPGGYVEIQDYSSRPFLCDGTPLSGTESGHPIATYMHYIHSAFHKGGMILDIAPVSKPMLLAAGFTDVVEKTAIWPIGHWPKDKSLKEIGMFARMGSEQSALPFGLRVLTRELGWDVDKVREMSNDIIESYKKMDEPGLVGKYYFLGWFVYARKPHPGEVTATSNDTTLPVSTSQAL